MNNLLWQTFREAGLVGQIILIILFIFSVKSWAIIVQKHILLRQVYRSGQTFISRFRRIKTGLLHFSPTNLSPEIDPIYEVYKTGCRAVSHHEANSPPIPEELKKVARCMRQRGEEQILRLEKNLLFLATAASTGPLLGILGTVWGVLIAFRQMGQFGSATIDAVGPGISEALLTTVFGLVVAIPALIGYNTFNHKISQFSVQLDNFITDFSNALEEHSQKAEGKKRKKAGK